MDDLNSVGDFMVTDPICASLWQPVSLIRQQMLTNSFSYLPILVERDGDSKWFLVSDYEIARYLRQGPDRKPRLAKDIGDAYQSGDISFLPARTCNVSKKIEEVVNDFATSPTPILVVDGTRPNYLLDIVTAFDIL